ncbi:MAG: hypothetical protein HOV94_31520 [Saccharothrix sp.]|nr:hypothetical protein [Saccharothrix sp.]
MYDESSGRFLTADPVIDNNDPQQLNGYAYANNSPVTFSDPTGLIFICGPDGVGCGGKETSIRGENWGAEEETYGARDRALQQANSGNDEALKNGLAADGIPWEEYQRALTDAHKTKWDVIKEVAWEVLKEISGWNDIVDCFSKGDIWACGGLVAGLVPWGKVGKILEAGYNAIKAVNRLADIVDKAKGVLRRVQSIADNVSRVANEKFQKLLAKRGESCDLHSFVATTLVLMADGSTKPIAEVKIGDKVKATDPTTGQTTDRDVVATIVHDDEGDMTRLTVASEDGTTGSVDATSWHPVWVDSEGRFVDIGDLTAGDRLTSADGTSPTVTEVDRYTHYESVYDLTIEGVHTYYVLARATPVLVHNCGVTRGGDESTYTISHDASGSGVIADLDSDGILTMMMHNNPEKGSPRGKAMFDEVMGHFGDRVQGIQGIWVYGDNLGGFNEAVRGGASLVSAARGTWTGRQAARYGFTRTRIDVAVPRLDGGFEEVLATFRR